MRQRVSAPRLLPQQGARARVLTQVIVKGEGHLVGQRMHEGTQTHELLGMLRAKTDASEQRVHGVVFHYRPILSIRRLVGKDPGLAGLERGLGADRVEQEALGVARLEALGQLARRHLPEVPPPLFPGL